MNTAENILNSTDNLMNKTMEQIKNDFLNQNMVGGAKKINSSYDLSVKLPDSPNKLNITISPDDNIHQSLYSLLKYARSDIGKQTSDSKKSKNYNTLVTILNLLNKTDFSSKIDTIVPTSHERNNVESILVFDKDYVIDIDNDHRVKFKVNEVNSASCSTLKL